MGKTQKQPLWLHTVPRDAAAPQQVLTIRTRNHKEWGEGVLPPPSRSRAVRGAQGACVARAAELRGEAAGALTWCAGSASTGPRAAGPRRGPGPGSWVAAAATAPARRGPCPRTRLPPSVSRAAAADCQGVSLGAATLRLPAASLGGSFPVRAPEAGLFAAPPGMSPRAPESDSQSSCTPLPRPSPHPRAPPRSATASGQEASGKRRPDSQGPEGGPEERGKGLGFPDDEPLEAGRREISVRFWKWVAWIPHPLARAPQEEGPPRSLKSLGTVPAAQWHPDLLGATQRTRRAADNRGCALLPAWSGPPLLALPIPFAHTLFLRAYCVRRLARERPGVETRAVRHTAQEERRKTRLLHNNSKGRNRSRTSPTGCS